MSLLELNDVSMEYNGKVLALAHINLSVERGDWMAIMGPAARSSSTAWTSPMPAARN